MLNLSQAVSVSLQEKTDLAKHNLLERSLQQFWGSPHCGSMKKAAVRAVTAAATAARVGPSTVELVLTEGVRSESLRLTVSQLAGGEVRILQGSDDTEETGVPQGKLAHRLKSIWSNPRGPSLLLDANIFRDRAPLTELPTIAAFLPKEL